MPRDYRNYLVLDEGMVHNPKIKPRSDKAFRTYIEMLSWCATQLTDGIIPADVFKSFGTLRARQELINAGLVEVEVDTSTGREVSRYVIHDYLQHQRSREDVLRVRNARSAAGSRGGKATARNATRAANAVANEQQKGSNVAAEVEGEGEGDRTTDVVLPQRARDAALNAAFEDAWEHWPKKAEAMKARAAFVTLAIRHGVDFLHDEVVRHGDAYTEHEETRFVPRLGEWLSDGRWTERLPGTRVQRAGQTSKSDRFQQTIEMGRQLQEAQNQNTIGELGIGRNM